MLHKLISNPYFNQIVVKLKLDRFFHRANNYWSKHQTDLNKSHQEIAGYSHFIDVQEAVDKTHETIRKVFCEYFSEHASVLDIGCGPGLFLKDFQMTINKTGIDICHDMIEIAAQNNPDATLINDEFLSYSFRRKYNLIYSIGVMQYIPKSKIKNFFIKIHSLLEDDGMLLISYPHAISQNDLKFLNINYINYSPAFINKIIAPYFEILQNKHTVDNRVISDFDRMPYKPLNPQFNATYKNSSILIARKNNINIIK